MTGLEIFFIVLGFACLCISFFVARKTLPEAEQEDGVRTEAVWTEREEQMIQSRVNEILSERQNELVDAAEEQMNRLCNEKIMAVDEFSRQILEKIESNHQEVVFMYNMLNEKEKEIKDVMASPVQRVHEPEPSSEPVQDNKKKTPTAIEKLSSQDSPKNSKEPRQKAKEKEPAPAKRSGSQEKQEAKPALASIPGDVNLQIQKMHKEGKSVLEISKALHIGQGEVKLVIALYGGKR